MRRRTVAAHLCVPALFTAVVAALAMRNRPFDGAALLVYLVDGYLFYAAPHLLWSAIVIFAKPAGLVAHAGFVAANVALAAIAACWLLPRDASGLPVQWMLYWPLAAILQLLFTGALHVMRTRRGKSA